jgi:hypothetical protein
LSDALLSVSMQGRQQFNGLRQGFEAFVNCHGYSYPTAAVAR